MTIETPTATPDDRAAIIAIRNAMPDGERSLLKAAQIYWAQKGAIPPLPTSDQIQAIIARNAERRRIKAAMHRPYAVEYDTDYEGDGARWAAELISGQQEPSVAYPGTTALRCVANFTETNTDAATAEGIAFCCNDTPEDDVTTLLALLAERERAIDEQATLLRACDEQLATHERRCQQVADVRAWLVRHGDMLGDVAAKELRQIVEADDASTLDR